MADLKGLIKTYKSELISISSFVAGMIKPLEKCIRADERERCAKIAENYDIDVSGCDDAKMIALEIRRCK